MESFGVRSEEIKAKYYTFPMMRKRKNNLHKVPYLAEKLLQNDSYRKRENHSS